MQLIIYIFLVPARENPEENLNDAYHLAVDANVYRSWNQLLYYVPLL